MGLFIYSLVQPILIIWLQGLQQSFLPNSISQITDSLVGFGGYLCYGATTLFSYVFFVRRYFGVPLIGLINFDAPLSRLLVLVYGFYVLVSGLPFTWGFL